MQFLTDRKRAVGAGSAKSGTHHWWVQRVSAVALIPLTFLFIFFVAPIIGAPLYEVREALSHFGTALIAGLMLVTAGYHAMLGMQIIVEDYISHHGARAAMLAVVQIGCWGFILGGLFALVKLNIGA